MSELKEYYLNSDNINEWVEKLEKGDRVYLSGTIYTARDEAHKKIVALLNENKPLPFELTNSKAKSHKDFAIIFSPSPYI